MEQRIEEFFAPGTMGAERGERTLEAVIARMNQEGWRVDQIVPLSFKDRIGSMHSTQDVLYGVVLCTKA